MHEYFFCSPHIGGLNNTILNTNTSIGREELHELETSQQQISIRNNYINDGKSRLQGEIETGEFLFTSNPFSSIIYVS